MPLTQAEIDALVADPEKVIDGDIPWLQDEDHSPSVEFRAEVRTTSGYPLFVRGSYNPLIGALTYALILKPVGRIYGLDMGKDHHNPSCQRVGDLHKHRWTEAQRDKEAYVPADITASATEPVAVWQQFCAEAGIRHLGQLGTVPPLQGDLWP